MSVAIFTTIIFILYHVSIFKVKIRRERPGHILPPTNSQAPGSKAKKTSHPIDPSLFFFFLAQLGDLWASLGQIVPTL